MKTGAVGLCEWWKCAILREKRHMFLQEQNPLSSHVKVGFRLSDRLRMLLSES